MFAVIFLFVLILQLPKIYKCWLNGHHKLSAQPEACHRAYASFILTKTVFCLEFTGSLEESPSAWEMLDCVGCGCQVSFCVSQAEKN